MEQKRLVKEWGEGVAIGPRAIELQEASKKEGFIPEGNPKDLETEFGLTEGNLNQGEMTLDQLLFMRPTASSSQYSTPINNLYICGPGTHPGGGLHGMNGYNAANKVLKS